jgi:hypothetical protein
VNDGLDIDDNAAGNEDDNGNHNGDENNHQHHQRTSPAKIRRVTSSFSSTREIDFRLQTATLQLAPSNATGRENFILKKSNV